MTFKFLFLSCSALLALACANGGSAEPLPEERLPSVASDEPIVPLPQTVAVDAAKASLGEALFNDPILSGDGKVACRDCHLPEHGLSDGRSRAHGAGRKETTYNSPTLYNVALLFKVTWDGRFDGIEPHIDALIKNPNVMAGDWQGAAQRLNRSPEWRAKFSAAFSSDPSPEHVRAAILEYERSLITPNSRFDRFLRGDASALSESEQQGYSLFKSYGCVSCHQGMGVGGNMLQRFGVMRDFFADRVTVDARDLGRFNTTHLEADRHVFRVPSLRNVALTAPYFHDGSAQTLDEAVRVMGRYQLGRELEPLDVGKIVAFLSTLTGQYRGVQL